MPKHLRKEFDKTFDLNADLIKESLYKKPNPNMYLASFASFMFNFKDDKYIKKIIKKGFNTFLQKRVLIYKHPTEVPLYFIGSIAYYFKDLLDKCAEKHKLTITNVIQRPLDSLIKYHQEVS